MLEENVDNEANFTIQYNANEDESLEEAQRLVDFLRHSQQPELFQHHSQQHHSSTSSHLSNILHTNPSAPQLLKELPLDQIPYLIEEVKLYPCVWNNKARSHKEFPKQQEAWRRIADKFNTSIAEFISHYKRLKYNFRKALKRQDKLNRSGSGKTKASTCQYFKELTFLTDTVSNCPTTSNVPPAVQLLQPAVPPTSPAAHTHTEVFLPPHTTVFTPFSATSPSSTTNSPIQSPVSSQFNTPIPSPSLTPEDRRAKKRKASKDAEDMNSLLRVSLQRDLQKENENESDTDRFFCLSLVSEFKQLTKQQKRTARLRILKVFCDLDDDA